MCFFAESIRDFTRLLSVITSRVRVIGFGRRYMRRGLLSNAGTTMKVVELVMAQMAYGWSPEELHFQHPYLTLGQIHSALAY